MTIKQSFSFAFNSKGSKGKLLRGGLFSFLFFTIFFAFVVAGYLMRLLCNSLEGRASKLPDWKNFSVLFSQGVIPVLIILAYGSPFIITSIVENLLFAISGELPALFWVFVTARLIFIIAFSILTPLALLHFAVKQNIAYGFKLGQMLKFLSLNFKHYFPVWLWSIVLNIASLAGLIVFGIGFFFAGFAVAVIVTHLYAQAYRASIPFDDDKDGKLRSSMAIPPPLK